MFKGWKTVAFFGLSLVVYLLGWDQIGTWIDPKTLAILTSIAGLALRYVTTTKIGG